MPKTNKQLTAELKAEFDRTEYLERLLKETIDERDQLTDDFSSLAKRYSAVNAQLLRGNQEYIGAQTQNGLLRQLNTQLRSNLATFRDRFLARLHEEKMEARFWDIDPVKVMQA